MQRWKATKYFQQYSRFYEQHENLLRFIRYFTLFLTGIGIISVCAYIISCLLLDRVPLTKWCGKGGIASSSKDFGLAVRVDKCCQKHDYCPMSINSNETKYGVTNPSRYTLSDCRCDHRFHMCLHQVISESTMLDKLMASVVGFGYFDVISMSCVRFYEDLTSRNIIGKIEPGKVFLLTLNLIT